MKIMLYDRKSQACVWRPFCEFKKLFAFTVKLALIWENRVQKQ